ncbi:MAG: DNA polymerase III subunit alpha [Chlamydiae bacterium CG10_big_fil_rev_8_21_14_0_10_35_9]|nr:MAG: DNA polymerase III subunit alpha [Chlamydiae bacterium CG10_big_fil_rev_8_21_14_0_10_35_9]
MSWIPLHVHSQYSILDSTASIKDLVRKAKSYSIKALALTDQGNMHGIVDFYKECKANDIKPIIGCELWLAPTSRLDKKKIPGSPTAFPLVFLAKNQKGYNNLCKLVSIGYLEGFYYNPRIDKETLEKHYEGLICLSGSLNGPISYLACKDAYDDLKDELLWFKNLFQENFYIELQKHQMNDADIDEKNLDKESWVIQKLRDYESRQKTANQVLTRMSTELEIPLVATNDIHYLEKQDWRAHEILLNIQSGEPCEIWERDSFGNPKTRIPNPKRQTYPSKEHYFKSPDQINELFKDQPEAVENTQKIADLCQCDLDFKTKHYPVFVPPLLEGKEYTKEQREKEVEKYLYDLCLAGIKKRYDQESLEKVREKYPDQNPIEVVKNRLDYEFKIIASKGMCDYLLIVYDFISWAKKQKIPVGPGRGSAAGSIIAYLIEITDIEPLRFSLFFERFINPERISYPDIDVDICMDRRSEVIDYTIQKYGKDRVAQIITFGTMKAKMAIKDVGRVLSVALSKVNLIAKLVPDDLNITIEKALEVDPELYNLYQSDAEAKMILDMAKKIEGSIRNTSIHAAGLIISEDSITEHIPVCTAKDTDIVVTQYSMKPVESVGMLKIDFLGLKTLTSIQKAVDLIEANYGKKLDWSSLLLDDSKTFDLLNQGKTLGVFQLESGGMQELAKHLHIDCFEEILAVGALYRPGPMDMIPSFINRKHGKEPIEIDHPLMKDILAETYGVMVYQEQVMQIASKLAGYSLGEGDILRKAMGKKDREEMTRQRQKFLQGAVENDINQETAEIIFNKIEKFASYGFNKSHATAYAYLSYTTAYLKANYPKEWMAALMTCDRYDLSKVAKFIRECQVMEIAILPPDVNEAGSEFLPVKDGIRFAMSGVKGVGSAAVDAIMHERKARGPFTSLYDFIRRIDTSKVGKKNVELLIDSGGFDFTQWTRDELRESVETMYFKVNKEQKEASQGIMNFFSIIEDPEKEFIKAPQITTPSTKDEILRKEKELLGFYLTGHPMEKFKDQLEKLSCLPLKDMETLGDKTLFKTAFIIESVVHKIASKSQKKFAIITISDGMERYEVPIWPDLYEANHHLLVENQIIFSILFYEDSKIHCKYLEDIQDVDNESVQSIYDNLSEQIKKQKKTKKQKMPIKTQQLSIIMSLETLKMSELLKLKELFRSNSGKVAIEIKFILHNKIIGTLAIDHPWGVQLNDPLASSLGSMKSIKRFEVKNT